MCPLCLCREAASTLRASASPRARRGGDAPGTFLLPRPSPFGLNRLPAIGREEVDNLIEDQSKKKEERIDSKIGCKKW